MGMQPILPVTLPAKKLKDAIRQCYSDGDGVVWCKHTLKRQQKSVANDILTWVI